MPRVPGEAGRGPRAALESLGEFQMRYSSEPIDTAPLLHSVIHLGALWRDCAEVFDYGRQKYAEWNWLKGMPWSEVINSCARHLLSMIEGEPTDAESGLPHAGHAMCNLVMLLQYAETYPEGDDRPRVP
jgi:Domain of unknown function (DUF5664)